MSLRAKPPPRASRGSRPEADATQKLQKLLAQAGLGSRRAMEEWIRNGRVTVNGAVATIGSRVSSHDVVRVGPRLVRWPREERLPRVILYHKPEGEIVSRADPEERVTVFERLPRVRGGKWTAVGRLDYNTGGLLVFTTSGELANRMMHPRYALEREYAVRVLGALKPEQLARLKSGIELEDGPARVKSIEDEGGEGANRWYRIVLAEGRNRIVRRMFGALGVTVSRLMRVRFGSLSLPRRLKRGQWLELPAGEVKALLADLGLTAPSPRPAHRGR